MKSVFLKEDILKAEKAIIDELGISSQILMENAGANAAEYILQHYKHKLTENTIVLSGKGNNAGDGFVIARHLIINNIPVTLALFENEKNYSKDALTNYLVLKNLNSVLLKIVSADEAVSQITSKSIVLDAVFGAGFKGELEESYKNLFQKISDSQAKVICIDTPSGLSGYLNQSVLKCTETLSMGVKKFETIFYEGKAASGNVSVINIGFPDEIFEKHNSRSVYEIEKKDACRINIQRDKSAHKYSSGKLYVIAGSVGLSGAAYLSSMAAFRTGCGVVAVGSPESVNNVMEIKSAELIKHPLPETNDKSISLKAYDKILERLEWSDCTLMGPGISKNEETVSLIQKIVSHNNHPFVIDAEGITAFVNNTDLLSKKEYKIILTPHFSEFSKLIKMSVDELKEDFLNLAIDFAAKHNIILVLKNAPTIITDGKNTYINSTGKENLATAGSGDVLAGIISALYTLTKDPLQSAISGTYLHGLCGDIIYNKTGSSSTLAGDLIEVIPASKNRLFSEE